MIELKLTQDEADVLKDLSYEISDTDSKDFRDGLKARRDLIAKVEQASPLPELKTPTWFAPDRGAHAHRQSPAAPGQSRRRGAAAS